MSFLLDTDTCSFHLRRSGALTSRFVQYSGRLHVPVIVVAELCTWVYRLTNFERRHTLLSELLDDANVLPFDLAAAEQFGKIQAEQLRRGIVVSTPDLMIASVALVHDLTLVTHNTKDYYQVPGLRLEDWIGT